MDTLEQPYGIEDIQFDGNVPPYALVLIRLEAGGGGGP